MIQGRINGRVGVEWPLAAGLRLVLRPWESSSLPACGRENKYEVKMAQEGQSYKGGVQRSGELQPQAFVRRGPPI